MKITISYHKSGFIMNALHFHFWNEDVMGTLLHVWFLSCYCFLYVPNQIETSGWLRHYQSFLSLLTAQSSDQCEWPEVGGVRRISGSATPWGYLAVSVWCRGGQLDSLPYRWSIWSGGEMLLSDNAQQAKRYEFQLIFFFLIYLFMFFGCCENLCWN